MRPAYVSNQSVFVATMPLGKRPILPFFPMSLPDESLASRVTRFHFERGNAKTRETYQELFGSSPFALSNLFLPRIEALAQRLPGNPHANVEKLIHEGTLLPIARLFTASTTTWASADYVRRSVGESGSTRICLQCIKEDVSQFETVYLHRSHQIPAVTACWKHGWRLLDHCPECGCPIESPKDLTLAPWLGCYCGYRFELAEQEPSDYVASSKENDIARFASLVLTHVPERMLAENLPRVLRDRALEMGFRWGKEKVDRKSLKAAMESHYSPTLLARLDRAYATAKTKNWFNFLGLTKEAIEGPFNRNLLLANYLFQDAEAFLAKLAEIETQGPFVAAVEISPHDMHSPSQMNRTTNGVNVLIERLTSIAIAENLEISDLWRDYYGAMKRIAVSGSKAGIEALKKAIEQNGMKSAKKHGRSSAKKVHPKDADWAEEIKKTASRLFSEPGRPTRISIASLVRNTKFQPATWPDAISFPLTRAACATLQESQWHFYARRVMWAMARYHGKAVARSLITEDAGLEHHRATDVYHYLVSSAIVPIAPFVKQLEAKGIARDWSGPCPEKVYRKAGRGYQKTGVITAYAPPDFTGKT